MNEVDAIEGPGKPQLCLLVEKTRTKQHVKRGWRKGFKNELLSL
jgi:hypothetical protein